MKRPATFLLIASTAMVLGACTAPQPKVVAATTSTAPASASSATAAPATKDLQRTALANNAAAPAPGAALSPETVVQARVKQGYRPVQKDGQTLYCRRESQTGTNFEKKICLTESQMEENEKRAAMIKNDMNRPRGTNCVAYKCQE